MHPTVRSTSAHASRSIPFYVFYRISTTYLEGTKQYVGPQLPDTPLIAFINAKSGGRVGPSLASILYRSLGQNQVVGILIDYQTHQNLYFKFIPTIISILTGV